MKVLFLTLGGKKDSNYGGGLVSNNNVHTLRAIYGTEQVDCYYCESNLHRTFAETISFDYAQHPDVLQINSISRQYDLIFLDYSILGYLVKPIKQHNPALKVVVFFHNLELNYVLQQWRHKRTRPIKLFETGVYALTVFYYEKMAVKYADGCLFMTPRNSRLVSRIYGKPKSSAVVGLYIEDAFVESESTSSIKADDKLQLLFVGSNHFYNVQGITWFVEQVMPRIDAKLFIVGKDMDEFKAVFQSEKVEVVGFAKDLPQYYAMADLVVSPLLSGEGMKVKIAEALMFGKVILGTKESFDGYAIDMPKVGIECNTAAEFIAAINSFDRSGNQQVVSAPSRSMYLENFTEERYVKKMADFLKSI
jgi:polysaccharide biosynthesis protein PslH